MSKSQYQDQDEINLANYVKVIFKRWKSIFLIFVTVVLAGFLFTITQPKIYRTNTILELGQTEKGLLESIDQLIGKINNGIFNGKYGVIIRAENFQNTSLINIISESQDPEKSKNALEEVSLIILKEHEQKSEIQKQLIQNDILKLENKTSLIDENIQTTKSKIFFSKDDIIRMNNKINHAKEEQKNLQDKVVSLEQVLIYNQDPGTQFALFDTKEKLENKKQEIEDLYLSINALESIIKDFDIQISNMQDDNYDLEIEINNLNKSLENIQKTKIAKPVAVSPYPIKPRPLLNTAIAGILGLFIGVFLAFTREWWKENMKNES
ncbi:hypothetical protein CL633_01540 [bacterium]|nr:hypothetical protein [bacterium]|tara:strand:+ start:6477 stop:7445 length:969 start_codon:yes stop_codon:yes gene_type:complete